MSAWIRRTLARRTVRTTAAVLAVVVLAIAAVTAWRLRSSVESALATPTTAAKPLSFAPVPVPATRVDIWGTGDVDDAVFTPEGLLTAGGSGIRYADVGPGGRPADSGLPTLRASALALWRRTPVVALAAGGFFRRGPAGWEEARSGFGGL